MVKRNWFALFVSVALLLSAVLPPALSPAPTLVWADFTMAPAELTPPVDDSQEMGVDAANVERAFADAIQGNPGTFDAHTDPVLGLTLRYPRQWKLSQDEYLFRSYGFTLSDEEDHLVLRVGWLHERTPADLESQVRKVLEGDPEMSIARTDLRIAGHPAVLLSPLPGIDPVTGIFLVVDERLFEIYYGSERFDAQFDARGQALLQGLILSLDAESSKLTPTRSPAQVASERLNALGLPQPDGMQEVPVELIRQIMSKSSPNQISEPDQSGVAPSAAVGSEAVSGCLDWPTTKFLRVPWNSSANNNTGRTNAGPRYYGEGDTHKYCNRTTGSNDYYALDFSFREWDQILAPAGAQVLYYGWATGGYQGYGRIVMLDLGDGYQYLAAHLRGFGAIYYTGQWISDGTIIGGAGGSGDMRDGRWAIHLHQAIYKNAIPSGFGAYYGGQSVQPLHVKYYKDGITPPKFYETISNGQVIYW